MSGARAPTSAQNASTAPGTPAFCASNRSLGDRTVESMDCARALVCVNAHMNNAIERFGTRRNRGRAPANSEASVMSEEKGRDLSYVQEMWWFGIGLTLAEGLDPHAG